MFETIKETFNAFFSKKDKALNKRPFSSSNYSKYPFAICVSNNSKTTKRVKLFDANVNYALQSLGLDEDIIVKNVSRLEENDGYRRVLGEIIGREFEIIGLCIRSENNENIKQKFEYLHKQSNGFTTSIPFFVNKVSFGNGNLYVLPMDVIRKCGLTLIADGNFSLVFELQPNSEITIEISPKKHD